MQYRQLRFVGDPDKATRSVPVTVSSETPVDRGRYVEILDHSPGAVDLSRAPLPLVESHDTSRLNIGIVEDLRVEGGRLRGTARFGESARAKEVFADVQARVVRGVSIGYELLDDGTPVPHDSGRARKFKFRPIEASAVAVPADIDVGFYRSRNATMETTTELDVHSGAPMSRSQRRAAQYETGGGSAAEERERTTGIMALATSHNLRELGDRAIRDGVPLEAFRGMALDALYRRGSDRPLYTPISQIGMSEREVRDFSVARLFRSIIENRPDLAPGEREACAAVQSQMERTGSGPRKGGLQLPYDVMRAPIPGAEVRGGQLVVGNRVLQRDLSSLTVGAGGAMVATDLLAASFVDLLRARTLVFALGAMRLTGLVGNVSIPRQTGTTTMGWVAQAAAASESDASFNAISMTPKTAHGMQDVTRDLLVQGSPAVEGICRADLLASMATTVDYAALAATGASNQPTGLMSTAGIGSVVGGTNGGAPTWDHLVALEEAVSNANADVGRLAYLTNAKVRSKLKRTQRFSGTDGMPLFERAFDGFDPGAFGSVNFYPAGVSNQVPSTLTKGTASGICSAILFGNWADLMIGEWGTAEILPDPYTQAANRIVRFHIYQSVDVGVRHPASFAMMNDVLTS